MASSVYFESQKRGKIYTYSIGSCFMKYLYYVWISKRLFRLLEVFNWWAKLDKKIKTIFMYFIGFYKNPFYDYILYVKHFAA